MTDPRICEGEKTDCWQDARGKIHHGSRCFISGEAQMTDTEKRLEEIYRSANFDIIATAYVKNPLKDDILWLIQTVRTQQQELERLRERAEKAEETVKERTVWANCGGVPVVGHSCRVDGHEIYGSFYSDSRGDICDSHLIQELTKENQRLKGNAVCQDGTKAQS